VIAIDRLQSYIRHVAEQEREAVSVPPFTIFFHPNDDRIFFNYAVPDMPVGGDLGVPLGHLRAAFVARDRRPRFEFIEEYAPQLTSSLRVAGFAEESRLRLMVCTPETYRAAPHVAGLMISIQDSRTPLDEIRLGLDTNARGFDPGAMPTAEAEAIAYRQSLISSRAFLAYLGSQPAGAGMFTPPLDGLTELVGITTLGEFRRRGIAAELTACAVQTAFQQGADAAFLSAADQRAGRVYERVGFQPFAIMLAYIGETSSS
jgi:ribosomal protein S18 acetylase RimI-like enzyme